MKLLQRERSAENAAAVLAGTEILFSCCVFVSALGQASSRGAVDWQAKTTECEENVDSRLAGSEAI